MNGMAYIGRVELLEPIPSADRIERIEVVCGPGGRWSAIAQKGDFRVGDKCEVYLQDALLPEIDRFEFMRQYKFRVRMVRLRKVPSEALVMPLTPDVVGEIGDDITELKGVEKYEWQVPASMAGIAKGNFPAFIPRTDEINFQKVPRLVAAMIEAGFYITEKADGTSCTFYRRGDHFGVCSRRLELKESDTSVYWKLAKKYKLDELFLGYDFAIQAEGVGPGIQGNPLGLDDHEIRVFDIYVIDEGHYLDGAEVLEICDTYNLPMVRVVKTIVGQEPMSADDWRTLAEGEYPNGGQREGIVVRPIVETVVDGQRLSFKVINLRYDK